MIKLKKDYFDPTTYISHKVSEPHMAQTQGDVNNHQLSLPKPDTQVRGAAQKSWTESPADPVLRQEFSTPTNRRFLPRPVGCVGPTQLIFLVFYLFLG
jgi:hypothetical protein